MTNKTELWLTEWAYNVFQRCVPEQYRESVAVLTGIYSDKHPSDETINKVCSLHMEWIELAKKNDKSIDGVPAVSYIKKNW